MSDMVAVLVDDLGGQRDWFTIEVDHHHREKGAAMNEHSLALK